MQTEAVVSLDPDRNRHPENILVHDGDSGVSSSTPSYVVPQPPAKRPTRQWAAWTREEEESFFNALRQVGKNFEKITCRVQSKNKDQVRHYYYRLVRRMNKLLGPGVCLDAKNSKDTNAAMLRWWSLLEKYSCKASKLHLKPRRFKIFIEALEHQLLKDRKKNVKKQPLQGENCPPTAPSVVSNQSRASGHDDHTIKLVLVDSRNIPKLGPAKTLLKRNLNIGVNHGNNRGDSTAMKPPRQRRKPGIVSSAAYKKWEKAAIAGVSLVADAAEHLERTATDKEVESNQSITGKNNSKSLGVSPLPTQQNFFIENAMTPTKLKLQLFPVDDSTRRALEMDKHNPYLELTLSMRKKISSVLEHLNRKWGNSSVACGELKLFPYRVESNDLVDCLSWAQDSVVSAADVYALTGRPSIFRLRYGWFRTSDLRSLKLQAPLKPCCIPPEHDMSIINREEDNVVSVPISVLSTNAHSENQGASLNKIHALSSTSSVPDEMIGSVSVGFNHNLAESPDPKANTSWDRNEIVDGAIISSFGDVDDFRLSNGASESVGEWADSLTSVSIGDLLSGLSNEIDANCVELPVAEGSQFLQQIPFSCDSFDAAIAAHISKQQNKINYQPTLAHLSSILDAEDTCDAFSFQKSSLPCSEAPSTSSFTSMQDCQQIPTMNSESPLAEGLIEDFAQGDPTNECPSSPRLQGNLAKNISELEDIYWPDSLGPLELDIPSSKYHSENLILSDSLGGLNRLIASSLDAFQNCSFFGLDKKESA